MSFTAKIAAKSFLEFPFSGLVFRLKPCVGADLMQKHKAILLASLPPSMADQMSRAAIEETVARAKAARAAVGNTVGGAAIAAEQAAKSAEEDQKEIMRAYSTEIWVRANDPENQRAVHEANVAALIASVVAIKEGGTDDWERVQIVESEADRNHSASPAQIHLSDLPHGTIDVVGVAAREASFGGEDARNRIATFCRQSVVTAPVRPDGSDLRPASE